VHVPLFGDNRPGGPWGWAHPEAGARGAGRCAARRLQVQVVPVRRGAGCLQGGGAVTRRRGRLLWASPPPQTSYSGGGARPGGGWLKRNEWILIISVGFRNNC